MADNLRITTPLNPNDSINKVKPNRGTDPLATIDTSRVIKKDAQNTQADKGSLDFSLNRNSVFQAFLQRMQQTPVLSQTLQKLLTSAVSQETLQEVNGEQNSVESLLSKLASEIKMDESQMLSNILFQQQNSTSFNSDLFKVLRSISGQEAETSEVKNYLGRFLKAYDGFFSINETMSGIMNQISDIIKYIPRVYREEIESQMSNLTNPTTQGELEMNLKILKENIIPTLGKYVISSNDMGETRERITLLVHDISRLNVSSKAEVTERFSELMDFCRYNLNIPQGKLILISELFNKEMQGTQKLQNTFIDSLMDVLMNNSADKLSSAGQAMLRDTITTLLLDNSAFMPFTHMFLPINYNGTFMFSEIWVEKDGANKTQENDVEARSKKIYLSFDIQGLGNFQAVVGLSGDTVECQINYPQSMKESDNEIRTSIGKIFANNGFNVKRVVSLPETFKVENEVLRKIYEGRNSIDVTI